MARTALVVLLLHGCSNAFVLRPVHSTTCGTRHCSVRASAGNNPWQLHVDHAVRSDPLPDRGPFEQVFHDERRAWVLAWNEGTTDEALYMLEDQLTVSPNLLLAFENPDDAHRFADQLEAEGIDLPQPVERRAEEIRAFCEGGRFEVTIVRSDVLLLPPSANDGVAAGDAATRAKPTDLMVYASSELNEMRIKLKELFFGI